MDLKIYTDGSCHNRRGIPTPMGCGVYIEALWEEEVDEFLQIGSAEPTTKVVLVTGVLSYSLALLNGTSNRAELSAILSALKILGIPREEDGKIRIFTDSKYCIGQAKGHFTTNKNQDLVEDIRRMFNWLRTHGMDVDFEYCKGHVSHGNLMADALANDGRLSLAERPNISLDLNTNPKLSTRLCLERALSFCNP